MCAAMAKWSGYSSFFSCVLLVIVCVQCIDIDFDDSKDGFFLKSPYHKFKPAEPSIVKESLILTHPAEVYKLRASYGPFEMYQVVPNEILTNVLKYEETFDKSDTQMHRQVIHNMDVSAHLVSPIITRSNPVVQVLVQAQPLTRRQKQDLIYSYYGYSQRWCAQIFVSRGSEQYTTVCVLHGSANACAAGIHLPDSWWGPTNSSTDGLDTLVFYDLSRVEQNQDCASVSNTILPGRAESQLPGGQKKFISSVRLGMAMVTSDDHKDKDLVFKIPQMDLKPGMAFEVPVKLEKNSQMKEFVIQVKVRGGLVVEGASTGVNSPWSVYFEAGDRDGTATVTAFLKPDTEGHRNLGQEDVMRWQFRVLSPPSFPTVARVSWTVDYRKSMGSRITNFPPEATRIAAKFNVISGQSDLVVAVLKERSLLNTAILTGKPVTHDLMVFAVSADNTFRDITTDSTCRSTDPEALKVSVSCDRVFLDGSETRGAENVTILVRTADDMTQLTVQVWVPEPRLEIQLSDPKLSQVRGWKVQRLPTQTKSKRSIDINLATHSNVIMGGDKTSPIQRSCRHKYQQSLVDVYARFIINSPYEGTQYYRSKKTYVRVTSLVQDRLKVANTNIAKMVGFTVQGVSAGKTTVQVISPTGKLMGVKEIRVGKDKVEIERMMVRVISGMGLHITEDRNLPGALLATVYLRDQLVAKQQEAVLDIAVEFKDGSMLPLSKIDPEEYDLKVVSMNSGVVEVTETISSATSLPPSIKAINNGKGEIVKVILKESGTCLAKKVRTLDTEYVHVQVDFAKDMEYYNLVQSDGYYYNNRPGDRRKSNYGKDVYKNKEEYFKHQEQQHRLDNLPTYAKEAKSGPKVYPLEQVYDKLETFTASDTYSENTQEPKSEALEQAVNTSAKHPSPLEIGMYVLVVVFIIAILVFTAHCAVFMVRYQRKRSPKASRVMTGSISQAPDWVWIGRATLERHGAGNAGCNHALMAEEDFNGNQMVVPNSLPSSRSSSRRQPQQQQQHCRKNNVQQMAGSTCGVSGSSSSGSESNRNSVVSTYQGSECSIRITSNPLPDEDSGMGYNEAEWDYEAMGMTYEQLMEYFDNLKESSA